MRNRITNRIEYSFKLKNTFTPNVQCIEVSAHIDWEDADLTEKQCEAHSDETGDLLIAKATFYKFNVEEIEMCGGSLFCEMDDLSYSMQLIYLGIFGEEGFLTRDEAKNIDCSELLVLDRIAVAKRFRGQGVGKALIEEVEKYFSGESELTALQVFPIQFEGGDKPRAKNKWEKTVNLAGFKLPMEDSQAKLREHYHSMGFKTVAKFSDGCEGEIMVKQKFAIDLIKLLKR